MNENRLQIRNLFEYAQLPDKQAYLDGKASLVSSGDEIRFYVKISSSPSIVVLSCNSLDCAFFKFIGKRNSKRFELENCESKTVDFEPESSFMKQKIMMHENPERLGKYGCAFESMEQFLDFAVYLQNLFDARVYFLTIRGDQGSHIARLSSIKMFRDGRDVIISDGKFSNEEMRQVLKFRNVTISKCIVEPDFELLEPISMGYFHIHDALWFKGPMLMQLDCESVQIESLRLQNADIKAFLLHWMKISDRKLYIMQLYKICREDKASCVFSDCWDVKKNWNEEKFDLLKITEGLTSVEDPDAEANLEHSLCFKRPTDGMLLTVEVHSYEWMSRCVFRTKS